MKAWWVATNSIISRSTALIPFVRTPMALKGDGWEVYGNGYKMLVSLLNSR